MVATTRVTPRQETAAPTVLFVPGVRDHMPDHWQTLLEQKLSKATCVPRMERDTSLATAFVPDKAVVRLPPPVDLRELLLALKDVIKRAELTGRHAIQREALSVRNRMSDVLKAIGDGEFHPFERLFNVEEGRLGIVVTFLAILELAKEHLIEIMQNEPLTPIYLKSLATAA